MTSLSTEELQRLLHQWDDSDDAPANRKARHLAPVLAAEVIRLRKAIEAEAKVSHSRANAYDAKYMFDEASHHRRTAGFLTHILEGDQA